MPAKMAALFRLAAVIGEEPVSYNAPRTRAAPRHMGLKHCSAMISADLLPFVNMDGIGRLVVRTRRMVRVRDLAPNLEVDRGKRGVAGRLQPDARDHEAICVRDGLRIDIRAAHDADFI